MHLTAIELHHHPFGNHADRYRHELSPTPIGALGQLLGSGALTHTTSWDWDVPPPHSPFGALSALIPRFFTTARIKHNLLPSSYVMLSASVTACGRSVPPTAETYPQLAINQQLTGGTALRIGNLVRMAVGAAAEDSIVGLKLRHDGSKFQRLPQGISVRTPTRDGAFPFTPTDRLVLADPFLRTEAYPDDPYLTYLAARGRTPGEALTSAVTLLGTLTDEAPESIERRLATAHHLTTEDYQAVVGLQPGSGLTAAQMGQAILSRIHT